MMRPITDTRPRRTARLAKARNMDITLHIGAHRTATTTFQHYMRQNGDTLRRQGIGFWGPLRTRSGLFSGALPGDPRVDDRAAFDRARRRIGRELDRAEAAGIRHLIVSEENVAGLPARNIREARLYPQIGDRLARISRAFDYRISTMAMTLRPQPDYWPSIMAFAAERGHPLPDAARIDQIARSPRLWQNVVSDMASAQGSAILLARHGLSPVVMLQALSGAIDVPEAPAELHLNEAPDRPNLRAALETRGQDAAAIPAGEGRWQPFDDDQRAMLAEAWLDDEFWLAAGAGGLATCLTDKTNQDRIIPQPNRAGHHLPPGLLGRGHGHGIEERRMVGTG